MTTKSELLKRIKNILAHQSSIWLKQIGEDSSIDAIVLGKKSDLKPLLEGQPSK